MPAVAIRQLEQSDLKCEAAVLTGDADVFCNIEGHLLRGAMEPTSIEGHCCGEYQNCSTWLAMKKVEESGGNFQRIIASMQDESRQAKARATLRDARLRRAQALMASDTVEGKRFRRALRVGEFEQAAEIHRG